MVSKVAICYIVVAFLNTMEEKASEFTEKCALVQKGNTELVKVLSRYWVSGGKQCVVE